jgi:HPt (histidine-containing phosphotransfer) domain-containing protein
MNAMNMWNPEMTDQSSSSARFTYGAGGQFRAVDHALALSRVGGDLELLQEIARLFLTDAPHMLNAIRAAIRAGDAHALERSAHAFKGCIANFGAKAATEIAFSLEQMGRNRDLGSAPETFARLQVEQEAVELELQQVIA